MAFEGAGVSDSAHPPHYTQAAAQDNCMTCWRESGFEMTIRPVNRNWFDQLRGSHVLKLMVLCLGVFGIILTNLPDMFPDSKWTSIWPSLRAAEVGFADLNRLDEVDATGQAIGILRKDDAGYYAVHELLLTFDPSLSYRQNPVSNSPDQRMGAIVAAEVLSWSNSQGSLSAFRAVLYQAGEGELRPVCEMRDLAFLIRDGKIRFWSTLGSAVALAALLLQAILADTASFSQDARNLPRQIDVTNALEEQAAAATGSTDSGTKEPPCQGFT